MAKKNGKLIIRGGSEGTAIAVTSRGTVHTKKGSFRKSSAWVGGETGSTVTMGSTPAQSISQSPLFYDYRYSTPDKFYFPRDRAMANSIWRDIYRRDATVAIATDMYAELPWSRFDLEAVDDGAIRKVYEDMFNALNLLPKFTGLTKDFVITGELILHSMFNTTKGYWEKVVSHNPDYIRAVGTGLAFDQPLLWMKATPEIKRLLASADPRVRRIVDILPKDMVNAFRGNKEIPLDPLNTTFIPRLNTSQEVRGTSLYTRLYRVNMYEDFIVNSSLAVAQRNASPVRLIKVGDPNPGGWKPSSSDLESLAEMFSLAESDPFAAILTHPWVTVEYIGVSDKALLISREWDFVERVKLLALGVAKAFLVGEQSFAAAVAGLQTLLQRLNALRSMLEQEWMIKKLCEPVAKMHEFYERPKSQLEHRIRVDRPEDRRLVLPKIKWFKSLDPTQDASILNIWQQLNERGIISDRTLASGAGVDLEVERRNLDEEREYKESLPPKEEAAPEGMGPPGASLHNPYRQTPKARQTEQAKTASLSADQMQTLARVERIFAGDNDSLLTGDRA